MGIYDRDYYRKEGPSFLETIATQGKVCKWLIAINVVAFILQLITRRHDVPVEFEGILRQYGMSFPGRSPFTDALELDVPAVLHGQVWRLLTCAFLHSPENVYHILFNMLGLWWFGKDVEIIYGPREFLAMYLTAAVASSLAFVVGYLLNLNGPLALGASGAVTAVVLICACHDPSRTILLFWLLPVPIWVFVAIFVFKDFVGLLGAGDPHMGKVAFSAHLGGAAFGFAYHHFQWRVTNWIPDWRSWGRPKPKLRIYREEEEPPSPVGVTTSALPIIDEQLDAKVNSLLDKINKSGKESLSDSEREFLNKASEAYKKKERK